jgi:putative phosphoesterase
MRIALISDIHGNQLALDAVLADARMRGVDRFVCLGDVATLGPRPLDVLRTLRDLDCPCIMGNHDEFLLDRALVERYTQVPVIVEAIDWCRAQMSPADLAFVRSFLTQLEIPLDAERSLLLFHGSPESHMHDLLSTTPDAELELAIGGRRAAVMAGGHTHIQMLRQHRGTLLINPGSVGMPFRQFVAGSRPEIMPYAEYALIDATEGPIGVDLRRVPLNKSALRAATREWRNPPAMLSADLLQQYA